MVEYDIVGAAVTLIAGLLIFLTLDWRLDVRGLIWGREGLRGTKNFPNLVVKASLVATFILAGASIILVLFSEYLDSSIPKIFFIFTVISVIILAVSIIWKPPKRNSGNPENQPTPSTG